MKLPHAIKRGDKGKAVKWVQAALRKHGFLLGVDGTFGPKTLESVKRFQRAKAITADGIVGPQTQAFLKAKQGKAPSNATSITALLPKPKPVLESRLSIGWRAVATMESWVGKTEAPAGSNRVPHLVRLARRVGWTKGVSAMGFSWCNFGVHLALALNGCQSLKASGTWGGHTGMYVPSTRTELERLVAIGKAERVPKAKIERGDILIMFEQGHIGLARAAAKSKRTVQTVECNTSSGTSGSQSNGDGCFQRTRNLTADIDGAYRLRS